MNNLIINNNIIGENQPCYIIAELSANHNQDLAHALQSIKAIKDTGSNAVKIQSYSPESLCVESDLDWFKAPKDSPWANSQLHEIYKKGQTPWEWHSKLKNMAEDLGLDFFSSPFDQQWVQRLESLNVPAYKIASLEITDTPLIKKVAATGKPVIISTGAATKDDIELALTTCYNEKNYQIALLKCTSAYPTPLEEVNLSLMVKMKNDFDVYTGISDHTLGNVVPIVAASLGASIIEKHFTLDKSIDTLDKDFSLDPDEFTSLVSSVRAVEKCIGEPNYKLTKGMISARKYVRSIFAIKDIKKGEMFTKENSRSLRPNLGMHPKHYEGILEKKSSEDIKKGYPIHLKNLSNK